MLEAGSEPKVETSPKFVGGNPFANIHVGERWQEIQGCNNWELLLDPIDPVLRAEIVRYGEFAQACYDTFDAHGHSKSCGDSRYTKDILLKEVGLDNRGYDITHFLYATARLVLPNFFIRSAKVDAWSRQSNWMGFVAVCTSPQEIARLGRRDILVAWRGTQTGYEWIKDLQDLSEPTGFLPNIDHRSRSIRVESGFLNVYTSNNQNCPYSKSSVRDQVLEAVNDLVEKYKHEGQLSITITGHSLGSALATLCAYDMAESQMNLRRESGKNACQRDKIPITVFSFAGPRVGNRAFRERVEKLGVAVLRVTNKWDLVTKVPGVLFRPIRGLVEAFFPKVPCYKHVGKRLKIDFLVSHYLDAAKIKLYHPGHHHLEVYMHVVDGYHGTGLPFNPTLRDFALVNKRCDLLKHDYNIPPRWWPKNIKGLVKDKDAPERDSEIFPKASTTTEEISSCVIVAEGKGQKDPLLIDDGKYIRLDDEGQGAADVLGSKCHMHTTMASATTEKGPNGDRSSRRHKHWSNIITDRNSNGHLDLGQYIRR